jgi:hypothetical protein
MKTSSCYCNKEAETNDCGHYTGQVAAVVIPEKAKRTKWQIDAV